MGVQVLQDSHHLAVAGGGADGVACQRDTVHLYHQLRKQRLSQQRRTEAFLLLGLLQQGEQLPYPVAAAGVVDVAEILLCLVEACFQIAVIAPQFLQIVRRDIQDRPFIEIAALHDGFVDAAPAHQHIISRLQGIPFAFDGIIGTPSQKNDNLVEGVVVVGDLLVIPVGQMEQAEVLV